jgi:hypothetical protein
MGLEMEWQGKFLGEFFLNFTVIPVFSGFDLASLPFQLNSNPNFSSPQDPISGQAGPDVLGGNR